MKNYCILFLAVVVFNVSWGQVGINTATPQATLDVVGNVKLDNNLFLENPGDVTEIRDSKLLIRTTQNQINQYDIDISKYGPINYVRFVFSQLSTNGLQDYDTKISTENYIVSVQGYNYIKFMGNTNVLTHSNSDDNNIEGHQIYAYKNLTTQTWFLRAFINNATFRAENANRSDFVDSPIDMFLNVIIYRKGFITKEQEPITVDMGNAETMIAPLPPGF